MLHLDRTRRQSAKTRSPCVLPQVSHPASGRSMTTTSTRTPAHLEDRAWTRCLSTSCRREFLGALPSRRLCGLRLARGSVLVLYGAPGSLIGKNVNVAIDPGGPCSRRLILSTPVTAAAMRDRRSDRHSNQVSVPQSR
jgi:hypothetical protein